MPSRFLVPPPPRLRLPTALAIAIALPVAAFLVEWWNRIAFEHLPFGPYFIAVTIAAWAGGAWPGLLSTAVSAALGGIFIYYGGSATADDVPVTLVLFAPFAAFIALVASAARAGFAERERTAEVLRASEARERARAEELEAVMRAVPAVVLMAHDPDAKHMTGSRAAAELLRLAPGASPSKTSERPPLHYRVLQDGRELPPHELPTQRAARGEPSGDVELEVVFDDGTTRRLFGSAATLYDEGGKPRGGIGAFIDVTKLSNAVRARDEFLAIASHELKTPLTALQLRVERLARSDPSPRVASASHAIQRQVQRLTALVNTLLDVSRLNDTRLRLKLEPVDLGGLVREVASRFGAEADLAGSTIEVESDEPVRGYWDRLRVEQVVTNLLSNALKYGDGKPVSVRVSAEPGAARIVVEDRGIGIPAAEQPRIFERFERGAAAHGFGGLGLGLWISRELVTALGGRIEVQSAPGEGAAFHVALPLDGPVVHHTPAPTPPPLARARA